MDRVLSISVCVFVVYVAFFVSVDCQGVWYENNDEILPDNANYTVLKCEYDLLNGQTICNCGNRKQLLELQPIRNNINDLTIINCDQLLVRQGTFSDVAYINHIEFKNIGRLRLESHSLEFKRMLPLPKIKLTFSNVNIEQMEPYSINGCVDSVAFINCKIHKINAFVMKSIESFYSISFDNTKIHEIERDAFKRLQIKYFTFKNSVFPSQLPSRAFDALLITSEMSISNCTFNTIRSQAIDLYDVNDFVFSGNNIGQLDAEAFKMNVSGRIIIEKNNFTQINHLALLGIKVSEGGKQFQPEILLSSNKIHSTDIPIRLEIDPKLTLRIQDLKFPRLIDCDEVERLRQNNFLSPHSASVYFGIKKGSNDDIQYTSLSNAVSDICANTTHLIALISSIVIAVMILIVLSVALFYRFWEKQQLPRPLPMVIPDGKTYRETQIIMQIEHAGLMKTNL